MSDCERDPKSEARCNCRRLARGASNVISHQHVVGTGQRKREPPPAIIHPGAVTQKRPISINHLSFVLSSDGGVCRELPRITVPTHGQNVKSRGAEL